MTSTGLKMMRLTGKGWEVIDEAKSRDFNRLSRKSKDKDNQRCSPDNT